MSNPTTHTEDALTEPQRKQTAGEFVDALSEEFRTQFIGTVTAVTVPEQLPPMSLHQIIPELLALLQAREEAEEEGALPDDLKVYDVEIQRFANAQIKEVNGGARSLRALKAFAQETKLEKERMAAKEKKWNARLERVEAAFLYAMQVNNVKVLETPTNKLSRRVSGGKQALETPDVVAIPDQYLNVEVGMALTLWKRIGRELSEVECRDVFKTTITPDQNSIRAALVQSVPCPECKGDGANVAFDALCPRCEGRGHIPQSIPGCRLLPRTEHLRVE